MNSTPELNSDTHKPMGRNTKIILGGLGILFTCCIASAVLFGFARQMFTGFIENNVLIPTEEVAAFGKSIIDYELPENYSEQMGMRMFGTEFIMIGATDGNSDTFFMVGQFGFSEELNETEMRLQFESSLAQGNFFETGTLEFIESREITVNGITKSLEIYEGLSESGDELRQASTIFDTAQGHGILMIMGSVEGWDEEAVNQFLESIE